MSAMNIDSNMSRAIMASSIVIFGRKYTPAEYMASIGAPAPDGRAAASRDVKPPTGRAAASRDVKPTAPSPPQISGRARSMANMLRLIEKKYRR